MKLMESINDKLVAAALAPVLLMAMTAVFTAFTIAAAVGGAESLFDQNYFLQELLTQTTAAKTNLHSYMATKNSDTLRRYIHYSRLLAEKAAHLDRGVRLDNEAMIERNIAALIGKFIAAGDAAIQAKRGRNIGEYGQRMERVEEVAASIQERANALVLARLDVQLEAFAAFARGMQRVRLLNAATVAAALAFSVFVILYYTRKMTMPIARLGAEAHKIADGNLEGEELPEDGQDEIGAAAKAFNLMKRSVRESFEEIRNKAEIERALMEERVKNLEMAGLLRNAELSALQARINPHFLFNTLNAGIQLAVVEEADRTRKYLERLTRLMRYSFRDIEAPVALSEEIECLQSYLYLMSIRFPGVFSFDVEVRPEAERASMPKLIIQPLAENAVRHGLKDKTEGARLAVRAALEEGDLTVTIEDNGPGISEERVREIFLAAKEGHDLRGSEGGGLGMVNVIRRLQLFSGREDVVSIESILPTGTRVSIRIPFREE